MASVEETAIAWERELARRADEPPRLKGLDRFGHWYGSWWYGGVAKRLAIMLATAVGIVALFGLAYIAVIATVAVFYAAILGTVILWMTTASTMHPAAHDRYWKARKKRRRTRR